MIDDNRPGSASIRSSSRRRPATRSRTSRSAPRRLLRRVGPSEIYAHHIAPELHGDVLPLCALPRARTPATC